MSEYEGLLDLAWKRYHEEPLFHARVHHAVLAVRQEAEESGFTWPEQFDGILKASAAAALLISEIHDQDTGDVNIPKEMPDGEYEVGRSSGRDSTDCERDPGFEQTDPSQFN
jgi:hypothetical protein